jgi:hypothetical protein
MAFRSTEWNLSVQLVPAETMSEGEGRILKSLLPVGTPWPMHGALHERASHEREVFDSRVAEMAASAGQVRVLTELLELMDGRPGEVLRIRRPGVVLTVEAAGPLGLTDSWVCNRAGGLP